MSSALDNSLGVVCPCSAGCGCYTDRQVDGKPLCVFCEDGIPCPAAKPDQLLVRHQLNARPRKPAPAPNPAKERSRVEAATAFTKKGKTMAQEKKPCKHCGKPTASKVGYCGKHFYISSLVGEKPAPLTDNAAPPIQLGVAITFSIAQLDGFLAQWIRNATIEQKRSLFWYVVTDSVRIGGEHA